jgi:hypothetical protein
LDHTDAGEGVELSRRKMKIDKKVSYELNYDFLRLIFDPQKYIFCSTPSKIPDRWNISQEHTDFGPQIPLLGSGGLFSPLTP